MPTDRRRSGRPRRPRRPRRRRRVAAGGLGLLLLLLAWLGVGPGAWPDSGDVDPEPDAPPARGAPGPRPDADSAPQPAPPTPLGESAQGLTERAGSAAPAPGEGRAGEGSPAAAAAPDGAAESAADGPASAAAASRAPPDAASGVAPPWAGIVADRLPTCVARLRAAESLDALRQPWASAAELAAMPLSAGDRASLQAGRAAALQRVEARLDTLLAAARRGRVLEHRQQWRAFATLGAGALREALRELFAARELPLPDASAAPERVGAAADAAWRRRDQVRVLHDAAVVPATVLNALAGGRLMVQVDATGGGVRTPLIEPWQVEPRAPDAAAALAAARAALSAPDAADRAALATAWLGAAQALGAGPQACAALRDRLDRGR